MKIWTISDLHVDYSDNLRWTMHLSEYDYQNDVLIIAGDITDHTVLFEKTLLNLRNKFHTVLFLPGNHDLWVRRNEHATSLDAFHERTGIARNCGILTDPVQIEGTWFVPLQGWYDYSFGIPDPELKIIWGDFRMCQWPQGFDPMAVTRYFSDLNLPHLSLEGEKIISFSHFLPRTDLIPRFVPKKVKSLFPVMGAAVLEEQIRILKPDIHIYGHSHFNRDVKLNGIRYINNAFGYPHESRITRKKLLDLGEVQ